jgi:ferric-dicitrate binding protein FerR (iron transport regulator)
LVRADELPQKGTVVFSSVKGTVTVQGTGGKNRQVQPNDKAYSGEAIQVGPKSETMITLADGSTLDLTANSRMVLASLKQPTPLLKNFMFQLGLGKVYAIVSKLVGSKSSFEIEGGGVICGVRGTEFSMEYDPNTGKVEVAVLKGMVSVLGKDTVQNFTAGQHGSFLNGHSLGNNGAPGSSPVPPGSKSPGPPPANPPPNLVPGTALNDLNGQFTGGILVNSANSLTAAQQTLSIHLIVPGREAGP